MPVPSVSPKSFPASGREVSQDSTKTVLNNTFDKSVLAGAARKNSPLPVVPRNLSLNLPSYGNNTKISKHVFGDTEEIFNELNTYVPKEYEKQVRKQFDEDLKVAMQSNPRNRSEVVAQIKLICETRILVDENRKCGINLTSTQLHAAQNYIRCKPFYMFGAWYAGNLSQSDHRRLLGEAIVNITSTKSGNLSSVTVNDIDHEVNSILSNRIDREKNYKIDLEKKRSGNIQSGVKQIDSLIEKSPNLQADQVQMLRLIQEKCPGHASYLKDNALLYFVKNISLGSVNKMDSYELRNLMNTMAGYHHVDGIFSDKSTTPHQKEILLTIRDELGGAFLKYDVNETRSILHSMTEQSTAEDLYRALN
jgi:hypothetical protein